MDLASVAVGSDRGIQQCPVLIAGNGNRTVRHERALQLHSIHFFRPGFRRFHRFCRRFRLRRSLFDLLGLHPHLFLKGSGGHADNGLGQLHRVGGQLFAADESTGGDGLHLGVCQVYSGQILAVPKGVLSDGLQGVGKFHFLHRAAGEGVPAQRSHAGFDHNLLNIGSIGRPGQQLCAVVVPHGTLALNGNHTGCGVKGPNQILAAFAGSGCLCHGRIGTRQNTQQQNAAEYRAEKPMNRSFHVLSSFVMQSVIPDARISYQKKKKKSNSISK